MPAEASAARGWSRNKHRKLNDFRPLMHHTLHCIAGGEGQIEMGFGCACLQRCHCGHPVINEFLSLFRLLLQDLNSVAHAQAVVAPEKYVLERLLVFLVWSAPSCVFAFGVNQRKLDALAAHSFGTVLLCVGRHGVEMPAETPGTPTGRLIF